MTWFYIAGLSSRSRDPIRRKLPITLMNRPFLWTFRPALVSLRQPLHSTKGSLLRLRLCNAVGSCSKWSSCGLQLLATFTFLVFVTPDTLQT